MKNKILIFAVVVIFLMSYAVFAGGEGPQHDNPGLNPDRPQGPAPTPGVVRTAEKSFVVKKYTGPSAETATKINLDFPAPKKLASSNFALTINGFKDALNAGEEDALASLGFAVRGGASSPLNHGFGIWKEAGAGPAGYSLISGNSRQQLIELGKSYLKSNPLSKEKTEEKQQVQEPAKKTEETPKEPSLVTPAQQLKICSDCDSRTKTGLDFEISSNVNVLSMLVCSAGSSEKECREASSCGIDKPCICEAFLKNTCNVKCGNRKGEYYVLVDGYAEGFDSINEKDGPYAYECPGVNPESLMRTRDNLIRLQGKVNALSAKIDLVRPVASNPAEYQAYVDVLNEISSMIEAHLAVINDALQSNDQAKINDAQAGTDALKKQIDAKLKSL